VKASVLRGSTGGTVSSSHGERTSLVVRLSSPPRSHPTLLAAPHARRQHARIGGRRRTMFIRRLARGGSASAASRVGTLNLFLRGASQSEAQPTTQTFARGKLWYSGAASSSPSTTPSPVAGLDIKNKRSSAIDTSRPPPRVYLPYERSTRSCGMLRTRLSACSHLTLLRGRGGQRG
jgi:hypothetical protein